MLIPKIIDYFPKGITLNEDGYGPRIDRWVAPTADDLLSRSPNSYLMRALRAGIYMSKGNNSKALEITETCDLQIPRQKLTYHLYRAHIFSDSSTGQFNEISRLRQN